MPIHNSSCSEKFRYKIYELLVQDSIVQSSMKRTSLETSVVLALLHLISIIDILTDFNIPQEIDILSLT